MAKKLKKVESVEVKSVGESEEVKALKTLFAAQKLATPAAYEAQDKDTELAKRLGELK